MTSTIGRVPPLAMAPSDFSSSVVRPPSMLSGVGFVPRMSTPLRFASSSNHRTISKIFRASSGFSARAASRCSAPMNSAGSDRMTVPPESTSRSEKRPTAGFEASPEVVSEPPHSTPTVRCSSGHGSRASSDAARTIRVAMRTPSIVIASALPLSCRPRTSTGVPAARTRDASSSPEARLRLSTSTPATFG